MATLSAAQPLPPTFSSSSTSSSKAQERSLPAKKEGSSLCPRVTGNIFLPILIPFSILQVLFPECQVRNMVLFSSERSRFSKTVEKRYSELEKKIEVLAKKARIKTTPKLQFGRDFHSLPSLAAAAGFSSRGVVAMPPQMLIKKEDLPQELDLKHLEDGTLTEDAWLEKFESWLFKEQLKIPLPSKTYKDFSTDDKMWLKIWLDLFKHPEYERMIDFFLAHELTHIKNSDNLKNLLFLIILLLFSAALAAGIILLLAPLAPAFLFTPIVLLGIASGYALLLQRERVIDFFNKSNETRADLQGSKITGDPEAGALSFRTVQETCKRLCKLYPEMQKKYNEKGDNMLDTGHPSLTSRIADLEKFIAKGTAHLALVKV